MRSDDATREVRAESLVEAEYNIQRLAIAEDSRARVRGIVGANVKVAVTSVANVLGQGDALANVVDACLDFSESN